MMKDHQIAQLVNELRRIAIRYAGTDQLREHLSTAVVDALKKPTEAAPVKHVYHVVAESRGVTTLTRFDGIARLNGTVETVDCYNNLKAVVAAQMLTNPSPSALSIISLSYLGASHA